MLQAAGKRQLQHAKRRLWECLPSLRRDAKIARMSFPVQYNERFDAQGKLDADAWLLVPRAALPAGFTLDTALADEMARCFFETVTRHSPLPLRMADQSQSVRLLAPLGKTALVLADAERIVDAARAETSWRIAGGFVLAHGVNYGGRFYLGAEWQADGACKLYSTVRRFPPRLVAYFSLARGIALYRRTQGATLRRLQERYLQAVVAMLTAAPCSRRDVNRP